MVAFTNFLAAVSKKNGWVRRKIHFQILIAAIKNLWEKFFLLACSHKACPIYYNMALKSSMKACPCSSWQDFTKEICNCDVESGYGEYLGDHCRPT